jgi:hypothetical protein
MPTFADQYAEAVFELQRYLADTYGVRVPWGTIYTTSLYFAAAAPRIAVAAAPNSIAEPPNFAEYSRIERRDSNRNERRRRYRSRQSIDRKAGMYSACD